MRIIKRFYKSEDGVTAVEFGLVGMPFIIMLLAILELGMAFAAGSLLEGGTVDAARLIRTGQVQTAPDPEGLFSNKLCDHVDSFISCGDLVYEVITLPGADFTKAGDHAPDYDVDGKMLSGGFNPGEENDVVLVRTFYKYHFFSFQLGTLLSGGSATDLPLITTMVIKNEPYKF